MTNKLAEFMRHNYFAVVGASRSREKFGNKVLRWYQERQLPVVPLNPNEQEIEGIPCLPDLTALPQPKETAISVITPPHVTLAVLKQAKSLDIPYIWLQPGAENEECIQYAEKQGLKMIYGGSCILVQGDMARL
ncbi:CoA-binding protein [Syncephalis plumigaleata]|nr:CoA-binding protein [Syncephalis plumigaleata]